MVLKSKSGSSLYERLFHLFLFVIGISIGLVLTLSFKLNFFFVPLFSTPPLSISKSSVPILESPSPPLLPPPLLLSLPPLPFSPLPPPPSLLLSPQENTTSDPLLVIVPVIASNGTSNDTSNIDVPLNDETYSFTHNMSDSELFLRASRAFDNVSQEVNNVPKVAFMFLTGWSLPLAPLWDKFFNGHEGKYSVYVHTHPSYNDSIPNDSSFFGRRIPSQPVYWGTISMIDAERRLLANALLDPSNQRFVLLSDSCIPVFNFTTVYTHLLGTNYSFLSSFDDPRKAGWGRYNHQMWPNITIEQWRKGSQWFEIHRDFATQIVSDQNYYKTFEQYCHMPCYSDEHYIPTMVNIVSPEMNSNRSVTWVDWSRGGPHPRRFGWIDVKAELLNHIKYGYECDYNGNVTNVCFLFARKFIPNTLKPLLKVAPWLLGFG